MAKKCVKKTKKQTKKATKKTAKAKKTEAKAVRNWARPIPLTEVKKLYKKGIKTIISSSGFTEGSIKYAKRYKMTLYHNRKKIT